MKTKPKPNFRIEDAKASEDLDAKVLGSYSAKKNQNVEPDRTFKGLFCSCNYECDCDPVKCSCDDHCSCNAECRHCNCHKNCDCHDYCSCESVECSVQSD